MGEYIGMNYKKWCALDEEDTRTIHYELMIDGRIKHCTSNDFVSPSIMQFIRSATIVFIKLFHNEWFVVLR